MNKKGASVSPCSTPVVISKKGVSPSGDLTMDRVFLYRIIIAFTVSEGRPYLIKTIFIISRFMVSKALEKSMKSSVRGRFLSFTPSSIRRIVRICPVVDH